MVGKQWSVSLFSQVHPIYLEWKLEIEIFDSFQMNGCGSQARSDKAGKPLTNEPPRNLEANQFHFSATACQPAASSLFHVQSSRIDAITMSYSLDCAQ